MQAAGQWNSAWDSFLALDPAWTEEMMTVGVGIYRSGVLTPKELELLERRNRRVGHTPLRTWSASPHPGSLGAGAMPGEVMEVLKIGGCATWSGSVQSGPADPRRGTILNLVRRTLLR